TPLLVFEVEHLHHEASGRSLVDLPDEENDPVFEQELIDGHFACALVGDAAGGGHDSLPERGGRWRRGVLPISIVGHGIPALRFGKKPVPPESARAVQAWFVGALYPR